MRLTLRTLLAWLDDTLKPTQVREIGVQVAGSPFAQELSDRIHRVTRQRRLSVPSSSGPEATDPNVVASYLDNELDPEEVAEYEKKCLTSDVNLAEVAGVHQILSLLGQKVKVPAAARSRMYQLVKGREAIRPKKPQARRSEALEPVTKPIQPWVLPEAPRRSWIQRFVPGVVCLLLIGLSSVSAWWSLTAPPPEAFWALPIPPLLVKDKSVATPARGAKQEPGSPIAADSAQTAPADKTADSAAELAHQPKSADSGGQPSKPEVDAPKGAQASDPTSKSKEAGPLPAAPAGSVGLAAAPNGILLRYNPDQRMWERLKGPTPLAPSNRLLCLAPFRATVTLGKVQIVLVGESEIRILPQSTGAAPALELMQGRLLLPQQPAGSLRLGISERTVTVEASENSSMALERSSRRDYGRIMTPTPALVIYCTKGELSVSFDKKQESLAALDVLTLDAGGAKRTTEDASPSWASDAEPSPQELQIRDRFARLIHPDRPVLAEIVVASEDESSDIKRLSILALKSLGDMSLLMPMLSRKGDPIVRQSALAAIRGYMGLGSDAASRVRDQLAEEFGEETASFAGKMLIGFSPEEASNPDVYDQLVGLLAPAQESIGVRELALDTLKRLTGRDDLGYDPDHPEGKGLSAWKDLQRQGKLRFSAPRAKVK
ncbi:MAG: hypothetical protein ACHRXM_34145 [Isosphaerales bacterium]